MRAAARTDEGIDSALRALADGNRRRILALVRDRPRAVGEIAEQVSMSQQAVSFHLQVLRGAGLVSQRRERTRHLYLVRVDGLRIVRDFLDGFWPAHLAALKEAAEAEAQETRASETAPRSTPVGARQDVAPQLGPGRRDG